MAGRKMTGVLAIVSILFTIVIYLAQLFLAGDAYMVWLILSMISSSVLFLISFTSNHLRERRRWMNSLLLIHVFIYLFGLLLTTGITEHSVSIPLSVLAGVILLLAISLIYRMTIRSYTEINHPLPQHAKWLHIINITAGIGVIGFGLFLLWGMLVMVGTVMPAIMIPFIPIVVWIILYVLQMFFIRKTWVIPAYLITLIPMTVIIVTLWYVIFIFVG